LANENELNCILLMTQL